MADIIDEINKTACNPAVRWVIGKMQETHWQRLQLMPSFEQKKQRRWQPMHPQMMQRWLQRQPALEARDETHSCTSTGSLRQAFVQIKFHIQCRISIAAVFMGGISSVRDLLLSQMAPRTALT